MIPPKDAPKLGDYGNILRRHWTVLLCAVVLSTGMGWVSFQKQTPTYQANTLVLITAPGDATTLDAVYGQIVAESRILSYQLLARSNRVTQRTIDQLDLTETTDGLASRISILPTSTPFLNIVVTGTDPDDSRRVADGVTASLIAVSHEMAQVDTAGTELVQVDQAGPAKRQGSPTESMIKAGVLGFVVSFFLVLALGLIEDRLLGRRQVERVVNETAEARAE
jgi:capsular polysaccharide biosynthesis protein